MNLLKSVLSKPLILSFVLCFSGSPMASGAPVSQSAKTLLLADKSRAPIIVLAPNPIASEKFAAQELSTYLGKISGHKIVIVEDKSTPKTKQPLIILGHHPLNADLHPEKLGVEQSVRDVSVNRVRIVGGLKPPVKDAKGNLYVRDRGTLYGVYDLLDELGVRWYRPESWGEFVPQQARISLPVGRKISKPPVYTYRYGINGYRWWKDESETQRQAARLWATRNRQNANMWTPPEYGGYHYVDFAHAYMYLLPHEQYFKEHPEYYGLINGQRSSDPFAQLALGNPDVQNLVADKIIAQAKANPQQEIFSLEPNDGHLWGQEPASVALDDPNLKAAAGAGASMSNRVSIFNNLVAARLAKEVPHAKVGWLAYNLHTEVPTKITQFQPNTTVMVAAYAGAYSDYSRDLRDPQSAANARFLKVLEGWGKTTDVLVHEYWSGYAWYGPLPLVGTMTNRLREYSRLGVQGVYSETHPSWGPQGLDHYMYTRLMWNPNLDVPKELDLYYKNYYGPAAAPMKKYHEMIETAAHNGSGWMSGGYGLERVFSKDLVQKMDAPMTQAQALVKGQQPYENRLRGVWTGYEFVRLFRQFFDQKDANQIAEAAQTMDEIEKFVKSTKVLEDGDVFDNGAVIFPQIFQFVAEHGKDLMERGRLMRSFQNPQIVQNLNTGWRFHTDPQNSGLNTNWTGETDDKNWPLLDAEKWWQDQGYPEYHGVAWYRKKFHVPTREKSQRVVLYFGAIDGSATVWINDQKVGEHLLGVDGEGWDKPFFFDITDALKDGAPNQIAIRVQKDLYKAGIWKGVQLLRVDGVLPTPAAQ
jgi:hypothetical protein